MLSQCDALDAVFSNAQQPGRLEVRETSSCRNEEGELAADLSLFSSGAKGHELSSEEQEKSHVSASRHSWSSKMSWGTVRAFIEVKVNPMLKEIFWGTVSEDALLVREQLVKYVAEMMCRQHRIGTFSVYIHRKTAYLMYWQCSGVVISEPIDYVAEPAKFYRFIFRLGQMTDEQLGYDPSVQLAEETADDVKAMRAFKPVLEHHQRYLKEALSPGWLIHRATVKDADRKDFVLLIGRHRHANQGAFGRISRGFVAYDSVGERLVFYKTYWRPDTETIPESEVYKLLHEKQVRYIATWIGGGDVCYSAGHEMGGKAQRTGAQKYLRERQTPRIHHCVVVKEVGRPLEEYVNSRELCLRVRDAVRGECSVMFSEANFMLTPVS